jgi:hypothetical protein
MLPCTTVAVVPAVKTIFLAADSLLEVGWGVELGRETGGVVVEIAIVGLGGTEVGVARDVAVVGLGGMEVGVAGDVTVVRLGRVEFGEVTGDREVILRVVGVIVAMSDRDV